MSLKTTLFAATAAVLVAFGAQAATINGSDFTAGQTSQSIGGIDWTTSGGSFQLKTVASFTGVGLSGATNDEIDIGEQLNGAFTDPGTVGVLRIGVLFDGPEFGNVNEVAQITINGTDIFTLTATGETTAVWTGSGSVVNLSPANAASGGVWEITNPFGTTVVNSISFTALTGLCGTANGGCTNQSDYTLVQLAYAPIEVEVPAPAALLVFGLGLLGLGMATRRRA